MKKLQLQNEGQKNYTWTHSFKSGKHVWQGTFNLKCGDKEKGEYMILFAQNLLLSCNARIVDLRGRNFQKCPAFNTKEDFLSLGYETIVKSIETLTRLHCKRNVYEMDVCDLNRYIYGAFNANLNRLVVKYWGGTDKSLGTVIHSSSFKEDNFDSFIDDALVKNNIMVVNHTENSFNNLKELISKIGFLYCDRAFLTKQINFWGFSLIDELKTKFSSFFNGNITDEKTKIKVAQAFEQFILEAYYEDSPEKALITLINLKSYNVVSGLLKTEDIEDLKYFQAHFVNLKLKGVFREHLKTNQVLADVLDEAMDYTQFLKQSGVGIYSSDNFGFQDDPDYSGYANKKMRAKKLEKAELANKEKSQKDELKAKRAKKSKNLNKTDIDTHEAEVIELNANKRKDLDMVA